MSSIMTVTARLMNRAPVVVSLVSSTRLACARSESVSVAAVNYLVYNAMCLALRYAIGKTMIVMALSTRISLRLVRIAIPVHWGSAVKA
jgi:hypothetical protein